MSRDIAKLKAQLHYPETGSGRLLEALTHRSYAVENNLGYDNQRLEFLGDAVLEIILTEYLFERYPDSDEGEMTKMRSALVRESALARLARSFELGTYIRVGRGEQESGGCRRDSTLADLFEALLGAYYLDGGFEQVRAFVRELVSAEYPDPRRLLTSINPKGLLQEYSQHRWGVAPEYTVFRTSGPEHQPLYEVEARLHGFVTLGRAASRKLAESDAARQLYCHLTAENGGEAKQ